MKENSDLTKEQEEHHEDFWNQKFVSYYCWILRREQLIIENERKHLNKLDKRLSEQKKSSKECLKFVVVTLLVCGSKILSLKVWGFEVANMGVYSE